MTPRPNSAEPRIEALEMRLAYQDDMIDKLNAAVTDQWSKIDALARQVAELRDRVQQAENETPAAVRDETPPHY